MNGNHWISFIYSYHNNNGSNFDVIQIVGILSIKIVTAMVM